MGLEGIVFEIGDTVKIHTDSDYYVRETPSNPKDIIGVVIEVASDTYFDLDPHPITVEWDTRHNNAYRASDLEKVSECVLWT